MNHKLLIAVITLQLIASGTLHAKETKSQTPTLKSQTQPSSGGTLCSSVTPTANPSQTPGPNTPPQVTATPPQPSTVDTGTLLRTVIDNANLSISAANQQAHNAEKSLENVDRYYKNLVDWITWISVIVGIILAVLGFKGFADFDAAKTKINALKIEADATEKRLGQISNKASELADDIETAARGNLWILRIIEGLHAVSLAETCVEGTDKDRHLTQAADLFTQHVQDENISDSLRAWGYAYLGYIYKRLKKLSEALEATETAIKLETQKQSAPYFFNAACYATLLGDEKKGLAYVREAVRLDPSVRNMAGKDKDLKALWDKI